MVSFIRYQMFSLLRKHRPGCVHIALLMCHAYRQEGAECPVQCLKHSNNREFHCPVAKPVTTKKMSDK